MQALGLQACVDITPLACFVSVKYCIPGNAMYESISPWEVAVISILKRLVKPGKAICDRHQLQLLLQERDSSAQASELRYSSKLPLACASYPVPPLWLLELSHPYPVLLPASESSSQAFPHSLIHAIHRPFPKGCQLQHSAPESRCRRLGSSIFPVSR